MSPGLQLQPAEAATTVRVEDGETLITDGPFAETREAIAGYLLFETQDAQAGVELNSRIPAARMGGAIEVRPIVEWEAACGKPHQTTCTSYAAIRRSALTRAWSSRDA